MEWYLVKKGLENIYEQYPTNTNASNLFYLACVNQDKATALKYREKSHSDQGPLWVGLSDMEKCQDLLGGDRRNQMR